MRYAGKLRLPAVMALALAAAPGGEFAVLKTGYRLRASSHESNGARVRLFTRGGGQIDLPASAVARFEPDGAAEPAAAAQPLARPKPAAAEKHAAEPLSVDAAVERFAAEAGLPAELIHAIVAEESAYRTDAVSVKGAVGPMQLMPQTAAWLGIDRHDPMENIRGGIDYLKQLFERYAGRDDQIVRAVAAYNAGPGRVEQYNGVPPFYETRTYVNRVIERYMQLTD